MDYGHDKGVCLVDDYVAHEWAFRDPAATKRYLAFLSAGGSKYPIDLLKDAGVDMTTNEPLQLTLQKMNRVMDEMEKILTRRPGL
jgi:oligoendopeptidase F